MARVLRVFRGDADVPVPRQVDVRIAGNIFEAVRSHVEDFTHGEEAGFLLCSISRLPDRDVLLVRNWIPIPESAISRNSNGSVLSWSAEFNSEILNRAMELQATAVLVHSHGTLRPGFSTDDRKNEISLFGGMSRLLDPLPSGTLLLGKEDAAGSFWRSGKNDLVFRQLVILGDPIEVWPSAQLPAPESAARRRLDRQSRAIGRESELRLALASVAVVGVSGGGSHVVQQLAHQGFGTLIPIDDEVVDESNLGRLVGGREEDIGVTFKTDVALRTAKGIDSSIDVRPVRARFPSTQAIKTLKEADVVVACLDTFRARRDLNTFCRRYLIPLVDIGITLKSSREKLATADGQLIVSLPGAPCLRCWFLTDAVLKQEERDRPAGYDRNPDATGDPQIVSMNGSLASEACNTVLDLITGYSGGRRGAKFWQYEGRRGQLGQFDLPPKRSDCPACAEEGRGDPIGA